MEENSPSNIVSLGYRVTLFKKYGDNKQQQHFHKASKRRSNNQTSFSSLTTKNGRL
jgi:hypothetical protein